MSSLVGKVAIVTGGSRGMGRSFAEALAGAGADVALLARPSPQLDASLAAIPRAAAFPCDIGDPHAVRAAFEAIDRRFGRVDILVNNAAVVIPSRIETLSDGDLQTQVATNFLGVVHTSREAIRRLRASGGGDIVNVSSESVKLVIPFLGVYAATKAALETFTEGLRVSCATTGSG